MKNHDFGLQKVLIFMKTVHFQDKYCLNYWRPGCILFHTHPNIHLVVPTQFWGGKTLYSSRNPKKTSIFPHFWAFSRGGRGSKSDDFGDFQKIISREPEKIFVRNFLCGQAPVVVYTPHQGYGCISPSLSRVGPKRWTFFMKSLYS